MDEITMFAELRPNDTLTNADLADIRAELFPGLQPNASLERPADDSSEMKLFELHPSPEDAPSFDSRQPHRPAGRSRLVAVAAAVVAVVGLGGLTAISGRDNQPIPPAAQPPAAPVEAGFHFETPTVMMDATSVEVITADRGWVPTDDVVVHSDPGMANEYTTLELTWHDDGIEQRMYMYFQSNGIDWWVREIRTYDGQADGDWMEPAAEGQFFKSPLGTAFVGDLNLATLRITDMTLEAFRRPAVCESPTDPIALLADYPTIDSFDGGFGATFQMIDTATCTPLPVAPYEFEYTVDDPTIVAIQPDEPIDGFPAIKTRVELSFLKAGATTVHATARNDTGDIVSAATMDITVRPTPVDETTSDTMPPPATIEPDMAVDTEQSDLGTQIEYRIGSLTERLDTLDYSITSTQTPVDAPTTIALDSTIDGRTIVIKMGSGTVLQPENHNRVPITIVEQDDLQVRGQLNSNSGWTVEIIAERSIDDGPLPTPDELQEMLYSLDP